MSELTASLARMFRALYRRTALAIPALNEGLGMRGYVNPPRNWVKERRLLGGCFQAVEQGNPATYTWGGDS